MDTDNKFYPHRPQRRARLFMTSPLYFVTFCTRDRRPILANLHLKECFDTFASRNETVGVAIGRYVIMPDHVHFFTRLKDGLRLGETVRLLKRALSSPLNHRGQEQPYWQPGYFDHILHRDESYGAKWKYVRMNPVRAGLVQQCEDWPYQGEIVKIDRV